MLGTQCLVTLVKFVLIFPASLLGSSLDFQIASLLGSLSFFLERWFIIHIFINFKIPIDHFDPINERVQLFFVGMPLFELMVLGNDSFPSDRMWGRKRQRQGWGAYEDAELVTSLKFTASVAVCTHNRTAVNEAVS